MTTVINPRCIPTPRTDAIRYRRDAEAAERRGEHEAAAHYRALSETAKRATAAREREIAAQLARGEVA